MVGLGNPGRKYHRTRHNMGRMAAESLLERSRVLSEGSWRDGRLALADLDGERFLVLLPETFMNLSGRAVAPVLDKYRLSPAKMLVMHDDIDLPLGDVRLKSGGGTAGHRGLASIVESTGTSDFSRIRIGVGRPPAGIDPAEYVLCEFEDSEAEPAGRCVDEAAGLAAREILGGPDEA